MKTRLIFSLLSLSLLSCGEDKMPKPTGHLSLEYPPAKYMKFSNSCGFDFDKIGNSLSKNESNSIFNV
jgi:hypothetical protein